MGDTILARIYDMNWNATRRSNMLHQATHGYRFTADVQDISYHLSAANRYASTMPAPLYFDRDFTSGVRCGEAEITTESSTFPASTTAKYLADVFFTRWYWPGGGWSWDPNSGTLSFSEQLSMQIAGADDKWNTASPVYGGNAIAQLGTRSYPHDSLSILETTLRRALIPVATMEAHSSRSRPMRVSSTSRSWPSKTTLAMWWCIQI